MKWIKTEKPVATKHPKLGDLSVEVEVPQVESVADFITFCGGEDGAVAFVNSNIETNAKNGGRAALRNAPEDSNVEELKKKVFDIVRDYAPRDGGDRQPGKAKKAAAFDSIKALVESGKEFTREELLAMMESAK